MNLAPSSDACGLLVASRLLRRGRLLHGFSLVLTATAVLLLGAIGLLEPRMLPATWLLSASIACGLVQLYCALRVDFDADLLDMVAGQDPQAAAAGLDASLQALGLQAADKVGRDWPARLRGARVLLLRQGLALLAQLALLLAALLTV